MEQSADAIFETFDANRKTIDAKGADMEDVEELKALETKIKKKIAAILFDKIKN